MKYLLVRFFLWVIQLCNRHKDEYLGRVLINAGRLYLRRPNEDYQYLLEFFAGPTKGESRIIQSFNNLDDAMVMGEAHVAPEQRHPWVLHESPFGRCWEMTLPDGSSYLIAEVERKSA